MTAQKKFFLRQRREEVVVGVFNGTVAFELFRRQLFQAQELPVKVGQIVEAAEIADHRNGLVRLQQIATG